MPADRVARIVGPGKLFRHPVKPRCLVTARSNLAAQLQARYRACARKSTATGRLFPVPRISELTSAAKH